MWTISIYIRVDVKLHADEWMRGAANEVRTSLRFISSCVDAYKFLSCKPTPYRWVYVCVCEAGWWPWRGGNHDADLHYTAEHREKHLLTSRRGFFERVSHEYYYTTKIVRPWHQPKGSCVHSLSRNYSNNGGGWCAAIVAKKAQSRPSSAKWIT